MAILKDREGKEYSHKDRKYVEKKDAYGKTAVSPVEELQQGVYGEKWDEIVERAQYAPTRFEYFVGLVLQGLLTGKAEKDHRKAVSMAIELTKEVEAALDKEEG